MKSFKQFKRERETKLVIYHFESGDTAARELVEQLNEAAKFVDLGKGRSIMHHKAHIPDGQDHLHFLVKGRKVYAVNKDGTAHDQSHSMQMQRWARDGAAKHYPNFKMPPDGLIEETLANSAELLSEAAGRSPILVDRPTQSAAEAVAAKA